MPMSCLSDENIKMNIQDFQANRPFLFMLSFPVYICYSWYISNANVNIWTLGKSEGTRVRIYYLIALKMKMFHD